MITQESLNELLNFAPAFLLIAVRAFAMIETAPLLNQGTVNRTVKVALAGLCAYTILPQANAAFFTGGGESLLLSMNFVLLLAGEAVIGIITGFFITIVFAAFATAGQFFSLQMGFGASETFDPLSQVENPLMGQYLNLVAMLVFLSVGGFRTLFLGGFSVSIKSITIMSIISGRGAILTTILGALSGLFYSAIIISLPILGTLFLTSLTTGLISKAAPTINILSEGFPISISVAFLLIYASLPFMTETFAFVLDKGWTALHQLYIQIGSPL